MKENGSGGATGTFNAGSCAGVKVGTGAGGGGGGGMYHEREANRDCAESPPSATRWVKEYNSCAGLRFCPCDWAEALGSWVAARTAAPLAASAICTSSGPNITYAAVAPAIPMRTLVR